MLERFTLVMEEPQDQSEHYSTSDLSGIRYENEVLICEAHVSFHDQLRYPNYQEDANKSEDQNVEEHAD